MNFDDYMKRIQYISNILEKNKYAEDILNSKELDIKKDFQYICLSSASNYNLVNEIIVRLAQNGNEDIVKENIKCISMSMWKDIFDKNEAIKKIFIENYTTIFENTSIITTRELERFLNDTDTYNLMYNMLDLIIKKLCTYDRASLISILKTKSNGIVKIKENLPIFFQKGEYDITTTYSKILHELDKIPEISKAEILKACNNSLVDMLNRETAVDNETNKLLSWIYDAFEEANMSNEEKNIIKQNIDTAIMSNIDHILDKSNYDKNTIKILKQFDCAKEKIEKNKNHFIEKQNKNNEEKTYYFNIQDNKEKIKEVNIDYQKIDKIIDEVKQDLNEKQQATIISEQPKQENNEVKDDKIIDFATIKENTKIIDNSEITNQLTDEAIQNLINDNIIETDQIIDKILNKKIEQNENNNDVIQTIKQNEINDITQENNQNENDNVIEIVKQSKIDNVAQTIEQNEESNQIQSTMQNQIVNEAQCVEQKEIDSGIQSKSQSEVNNIIKYANEDEQCDEIKYADETENSYSKMENKIEQQGEDSNSLENIEFANEDVVQNQSENTQLTMQNQIVNEAQCVEQKEIDSGIQSKSQSEVNNIIKYANEDEQCDEIKYADETENSYSKMENKIEQQGEDSNSLENIEFANEDVVQNQSENTQLITQKNNDVDYIQLSEIDEEEHISVFKRLWMKVTKLFKLKSENENNIN